MLKRPRSWTGRSGLPTMLIDRVVYRLYGLSDEEVAVVENTSEQ